VIDITPSAFIVYKTGVRKEGRREERRGRGEKRRKEEKKNAAWVTLDKTALAPKKKDLYFGCLFFTEALFCVFI
jgi:hypothetical protein